MPVFGDPDFARFDNVGVIQPEGFDRCPTNGGKAIYLYALINPGKVLCPSLLARVEQADHLLGERIDGLGFCALELITAIAGCG